MPCSQEGKGGLTSIKNVEREELIRYRPFPVNRLNNNVGERPRVGIPYVRDSNFRKMDINQTLSRDSKFFFRQKGADTPRLGEALPSLPDGRTRDEMKGGKHSSMTGVFDKSQVGEGKVKDTIKKVGHTIKKGVEKGLKFVKDKKIISEGLDIASSFLPAQFAIPVKGASILAKQKGFGAGQYERAKEELKGTSAMPAGIDKQSFVPTHPLNFNRARINKI